MPQTKLTPQPPVQAIVRVKELKRRLWRVYEQPILQGPVARRKGQRDPYTSPKTRDGLKSMLIVKTGDQGERSLFPDRQHNISVLHAEDGWQPLRRLNGLVRNILLRCNKDRVTVCPEYLCGVMNLRIGALSGEREVQEWSLGTPACQRLFKWCGTPAEDLFMRKRIFKVPNTSAQTSQTRRPWEEML